MRLSGQADPDIYHASRRAALHENVTVLAGGRVDYDDESKTENARVSDPLYHIDNIVKPVSRAGHAGTVIFHIADALCCIPSFSKFATSLTRAHF